MRFVTICRSCIEGISIVSVELFARCIDFALSGSCELICCIPYESFGLGLVEAIENGLCKNGGAVFDHISIKFCDPLRYYLIQLQ
jgi:hypothetical protein